jgi:hypothetical protein
MANYSGKQADVSAYIKQFVYSAPISLWKKITYNGLQLLTPTPTPTSTQLQNNKTSVYIPGNLYIDGSIIVHPFFTERQNVGPINEDIFNNLLNLNVVSFNIKNDSKTYYGFHEPDKDCAEIIPLLVKKIQDLQNQIDNLSLTE